MLAVIVFNLVLHYCLTFVPVLDHQCSSYGTRVFLLLWRASDLDQSLSKTIVSSDILGTRGDYFTLLFDRCALYFDVWIMRVRFSSLVLGNLEKLEVFRAILCFPSAGNVLDVLISLH